MAHRPDDPDLLGALGESRVDIGVGGEDSVCVEARADPHGRKPDGQRNARREHVEATLPGREHARPLACDFPGVRRGGERGVPDALGVETPEAEGVLAVLLQRGVPRRRGESATYDRDLPQQADPHIGHRAPGRWRRSPRCRECRGRRSARAPRRDVGARSGFPGRAGCRSLVGGGDAYVSDPAHDRTYGVAQESRTRGWGAQRGRAGVHPLSRRAGASISVQLPHAITNAVTSATSA